MHLLDDIPFEPGAFYIMDRAYLDFERLHALHRAGAFFVTRTKAGVILKRRYSRPVSTGTGVRSDQTVVLGTSGMRCKRWAASTVERCSPGKGPIPGKPVTSFFNYF